MPAWSLTGSVFGMQATAVNPPATAEAAPVATVSLCSCPGSRRWTWMSISPGVTTQPRATSNTSAPFDWQVLADAPDHAVFDQHVELAVPAVGGIDHPPVLQQ